MHEKLGDVEIEATSLAKREEYMKVCRLYYAAEGYLTSKIVYQRQL